MYRHKFLRRASLRRYTYNEQLTVSAAIPLAAVLSEGVSAGEENVRLGSAVFTHRHVEQSW